MKNKLKVIDDSQKEKPWYSEGLRFKCTGCGGCCTGAPGVVWVSDEEIAIIASHLKMTVQEFTRRHLRQMGDRLSLKELANYDCIFLKERKCTIYNVRPQQCRTFPWWAYNLSSREAWEEAAQHCEGIDHADAPLISRETIEGELQGN